MDVGEDEKIKKKKKKEERGKTSAKLPEGERIYASKI